MKYVERMKWKQRGVEPHEIPLEPADSRCEICGNVARLVWDHNHDLEELGFPLAECHRGWLCNPCNLTLGLVGDNVQGLMRFLRYVRR